MSTYYAMTDSELNAIANAINEKTGESGTMTGSQFASKISSIGSTVDQMLTQDSTIYINTPVPDYGFYNNTKIKHVICGTGCTSIGARAFQNCTNLVSVSANSVTTLGQAAFDGCTKLASIAMNSLLTIDDGYTSTEIHGCFTYTVLTSVELPACTYVGSLAFKGLTTLISFTGNSVLTTGSSVFDSCSNLKNVSMNSLTKVNNSLIRNCTSLEYIYFPSATSTSNYAFYGCTGLKEVIISAATTSIGTSTFYNCSNLDTIILLRTSSITTLTNSENFTGCTKLLNNSGADAHIYVPSALLSSYNVNYWNKCSDKLTAYEPDLTIAGSTYTCTYGQTWSEWIESEDNTGGYVIVGNNICTSDKTKYITSTTTGAVDPTDYIIALTYTTTKFTNADTNGIKASTISTFKIPSVKVYLEEE